MIRASAPGKIVLSGEYAVLAGAPAICMAIDRRARVAVAPSAADCHTVVAPGYSDTEGRFTSAGERIRWLEGESDYVLVDALWRALQPASAPNLALTLDTVEFRDRVSNDKMGLGSSAALTVALAFALGRQLSIDINLTETAIAAHRILQDNRGSGVDIACSVAGGVIDFRMDDMSVSKIDWPDDLACAVLWSGVAASSSDRVARFASARPKPTRDELVGAATATAEAWRDGDVEELLRRFKVYGEILQRFSLDHALGIYDSGHEQVARAALASNLVYKPCGAGGGDIGIVLGSDADAVKRFARDSEAYGFRPVEAGIDSNGIKLDD